MYRATQPARGDIAARCVTSGPARRLNGMASTHRDRWSGTLALSSLGLLFGAVVPFGFAVSDESPGLVLALGVPYALVAAGIFGYVAWESYEPSAQVVETPAARRIVTFSAVVILAARLVWYVGIVFIAVTVGPSDRSLGIVLISLLAAVNLAASIIISGRLKGRVASNQSSGRG